MKKPEKTLRVVLDTSPVISLSIIDKLDLLTHLFGEVCIPYAVWEELEHCGFLKDFSKVESFFKKKVRNIEGLNELILVTDYGESEAMLLYKELKADYLVIDDKKARLIAEQFGINCIGTLAILMKAKEKELLDVLRPLFKHLLEKKRHYSRKILNAI